MNEETIRLYIQKCLSEDFDRPVTEDDLHGILTLALHDIINSREFKNHVINLVREEISYDL